MGLGAGGWGLVNGSCARSSCRRSRIGPRFDDEDPIGGDAEIGDAGCRGTAGDDDGVSRGERTALADLERGCERGINPDLVGQGMMDQRDDAQPIACTLRLVGQSAQGETVSPQGDVLERDPIIVRVEGAGGGRELTAEQAAQLASAVARAAAIAGGAR